MNLNLNLKLEGINLYFLKNENQKQKKDSISLMFELIELNFNSINEVELMNNKNNVDKLMFDFKLERLNALYFNSRNQTNQILFNSSINLNLSNNNNNNNINWLVINIPFHFVSS